MYCTYVVHVTLFLTYKHHQNLTLFMKYCVALYIAALNNLRQRLREVLIRHIQFTYKQASLPRWDRVISLANSVDETTSGISG